MQNTARRNTAVWFGAVMAVIGILGFIAQNGGGSAHLLGLFYVDTAFNSLFVATGLLGLIVGFSRSGERSYFRAMAVVYAIWAVVGLFSGSGQVFGFINNNGWDVALTALVAIVAARYGFATLTAPTTSNEAATPASGQAMSFGEYQDQHRRR